MDMKIYVEVTEQQAAALDELAERTGKARTEIIREALDEHVKSNCEPLSAFYGLWADNPETQDAQAYVDKLRAEWDREWDR